MLAHHESILAPDERKAGPKLEEEFLDLLDQRSFKMTFMNDAVGIDEIQKVGILEQFDGRLLLLSGQRSVEIGDRLALAFVQPGLNLVQQDASLPASVRGSLSVPIS